MPRSLESEFRCVCSRCLIQHLEDAGRLTAYEPFDILVWALEGRTEADREAVFAAISEIVGSHATVADGVDASSPAGCGEFN